MAEAQTNVGSAAQGFTALPTTRQVGLLLGLAASIAIGFSVVLWSKQPEMRPLLGEFQDQDVGQVVEVLEQNGIPYKLDSNSGMLLVAGDRLHDARIKLASEGLPRGAHMGFEILDKKSSFGTSQFMELALYKRALEGELARSISNIAAIKSARVHLAIPKQAAFTRNRKKPSGSVFVDLLAGRSLEKEQVSAITHLVAASISGLTSERVSVIDENGRLLTAGQDSQLGLSTRQLDYIHNLENRLSSNILNILEPIVGVGNVKAQVSADIDFTMSEETNESYEPKKDALRSEYILAERDGRWKQKEAASPGVASNKPADAENNTSISTSKSGDSTPSALETKKQMTRNYELDRRISHKRNQIGQVKRLSVAVVLNKDAVKAGSEGESPTEQFNQLIKEAVGFNKDRADSVNIMITPFAKPEPIEELEAAPIWKQDWFWSVAKQVLAALFVLFLVLGVLRPILKSLANKELPTTQGGVIRGSAVGQAMPQQQAMGYQADARHNMAAAPGTAQLGMAGMAAVGHAPVAGQPQLGGGPNYQTQLNMAQSIAQESPTKTAQMMKEWLSENESNG